MIFRDKRLWISIIVILIAAALFAWSRRIVTAPTVPTQSDATASSTASIASDAAASSTSVYTYSCDGDKSIAATFHLPQDDFVNIHLSDGRAFILAHVISADGARYANASESFVFWTKGVTAFVMENGTTTYSGCVANRFP